MMTIPRSPVLTGTDRLLYYKQHKGVGSTFLFILGEMKVSIYVRQGHRCEIVDYLTL